MNRSAQTDNRDRFGRLPTDPMYRLWPAGDNSDMETAEARIVNARNEAERAGQPTAAEKAEMEALHDAEAALTARLQAATKQLLERTAEVRKIEKADVDVHMRRGRVAGGQPWTFGPSNAGARALEAAQEARRAFETERDEIQKERGRLVAAEREIVARAEARQRAIQLRLNEEEARRSRKAQGIPEPERQPSVVRHIPVGTAAGR